MKAKHEMHIPDTLRAFCADRFDRNPDLHITLVLFRKNTIQGLVGPRLYYKVVQLFVYLAKFSYSLLYYFYLAQTLTTGFEKRTTTNGKF